MDFPIALKGYCRVCGYFNDDGFLPWGENGLAPSYGFCPCCNAEWGFDDFDAWTISECRARWIAEGAKWSSRRRKPDGLTTYERLKRIGVEI